MPLGQIRDKTRRTARSGTRRVARRPAKEPFAADPHGCQSAHNNLRHLNLNLLPIFQVLTEQQSLSRAAVILGMSQSAVSHALTKLRAHFDDPLFIRVKQGVEPTARAIQLSTPISLALNLIRDEVVTRDRAGEAPAALQLRCGVTDPLDEGPALASALMQAVRQLSADATLTSSLVGDLDWKRMLRLRQLDMVFDSKPVQDDDLISELVVERKIVCFVREGNPLADRELDLPLYLSTPHVIMDVGNKGTRSPLRESLAAAGLERTIAARVHSHAHAALMVSQSDMIASGFAQDVTHYARQFKLRILPCPFIIPPSPLYMTWLRVRTGDRLHRRFRRAVTELCLADI